VEPERVTAGVPVGVVVVVLPPLPPLLQPAMIVTTAITKRTPISVAVDSRLRRNESPELFILTPDS